MPNWPLSRRPSRASSTRSPRRLRLLATRPPRSSPRLEGAKPLPDGAADRDGRHDDALVVPVTRLGRPRWYTTPSGREKLWGFIFIGPWLIGLALLTAGPMIASLILSLTDFDLVHPDAVKFIGIDNYVRMVSDPNVAEVPPRHFQLRHHRDPRHDARQSRRRVDPEQPEALRAELLPDALLHADPDPARRRDPRLDRLPQHRDGLAERDHRVLRGQRARTGSTARPGSTRPCRSSACGASATSC